MSPGLAGAHHSERDSYFQTKNGRWGPYRQASPSPARHRPGARSARRQRWCFPCIADQSSQGVFAMRLSSWLRSARPLLEPSGTENGHHPTRLRKRAMAAPLRVERLEDRTVPRTFMVDTLADSGTGSLQQAVLDANANPGADLVRFAPSARDGTITLTSGQLSITDDLQIDGPGVQRLTISGNDASRVFSVSGSTTDVEIRDLTIANGRATDATVVGPIGPVTVGAGLLNTGAR